MSRLGLCRALVLCLYFITPCVMIQRGSFILSPTRHTAELVYPAFTPTSNTSDRKQSPAHRGVELKCSCLATSRY
jgi:hypothetical protein